MPERHDIRGVLFGQITIERHMTGVAEADDQFAQSGMFFEVRMVLDRLSTAPQATIALCRPGRLLSL